MHAHRLLNIVNICRRLGLEPDPWQLDVLRGEHQRLLLNCSRQAGKSTVAALLAFINAMTMRDATILLLSRSQRQSAELFRKIADACRRLEAPNVKRLTNFELEMKHGSRIISLPCSADTIRGYSAVDMLVIDEAARVPDELYRTVRPMLAVSQGRLMCMSTPNGKRGFFWEAWAHGGDDWQRIEIPASQVSRITPEFLAEERRNLGAAWFRQEYECSFEAQEGLVYPEFAKQVAPGPGVTVPAVPGMRRDGSFPPGERVGGIDFGFRNPFAAVWGHRDRDGVLWLTGEHYVREQPLSHHAKHLPRDVRWYADPSGANECSELAVAASGSARASTSCGWASWR